MNKLEVIQSKICLTKEDLKIWLNISRFRSKKIVFSNGCFDIIHKGHVEYLAKAANFGDILIVGLNSDSSVRKLKGEGRPVQDETSRAIVLASMHYITKVVLFDENTPYELIKYIKPDVLVKGSDYKAEDIVGYDIVNDNGGKVETIDFVDGYSTSSIIKKF